MTPRFRDRRLRLLAAAAIAGACSVATRQAPDTIVFSHNVHAEQGIACGDCHQGLSEDAEREVDPLMKMAACGACHDVASADGCGACHTNAAAPGTYKRPPAAHLHFSHQRHGERSADCARCHAEAATAPRISERNRLLPGHPECGACHRDDIESGDCRLCHDRLDLYQREPETLYSHEQGFFEKHGLEAAGGADVCATCHDPSFCSDCHAKTMTVVPSFRLPEHVDRSFMHRGEWISRHVFAARTGDTSCLKCHGTTFCAACHERSGAGAALGRTSPHPDTWLQAGAADSHSRAARRRIAECATCHDQGPASICVRCHRSSGVNPHPPGWKPPVSRGERAAHKMCSICHTD